MWHNYRRAEIRIESKLICAQIQVLDLQHVGCEVVEDCHDKDQRVDVQLGRALSGQILDKAVVCFLDRKLGLERLSILMG